MYLIFFYKILIDKGYFAKCQFNWRRKRELFKATENFRGTDLKWRKSCKKRTVSKKSAIDFSLTGNKINIAIILKIKFNPNTPKTPNIDFAVNFEQAD